MKHGKAIYCKYAVAFSRLLVEDERKNLVEREKKSLIRPFFCLSPATESLEKAKYAATSSILN